MKTATLILASRSPRRAKLLDAAGFAFVQVDPTFDDPAWPLATTARVAASTLAGDLANQKARSILLCKDLTAQSRCVVLAADTIVTAPDGRLMGQPRDTEHARTMLQLLVNQTHQVWTGVCLVDPANGQSETFCDGAWVTLGAIDNTQLDAYVQSGQWRGKAGGYNLFDLQTHWPMTVAGDPTTVVGLPMKALVPRLRHWVGPIHA